MDIVIILFLLVAAFYVVSSLVYYIFAQPIVHIPSEEWTMSKNDKVLSWIPSEWMGGYEENKLCKTACNWGGMPGPNPVNKVDPSPNNPQGQPLWCFTDTKNQCKEDPRWGFCRLYSPTYQNKTEQEYKFSPSQNCK